MDWLSFILGIVATLILQVCIAIIIFKKMGKRKKHPDEGIIVTGIMRRYMGEGDQQGRHQ